jgi:hypothetical protein
MEYTTGGSKNQRYEKIIFHIFCNFVFFCIFVVSCIFCIFVTFRTFVVLFEESFIIF